MALSFPDRVREDVSIIQKTGTKLEDEKWGVLNCYVTPYEVPNRHAPEQEVYFFIL